MFLYWNELQHRSPLINYKPYNTYVLWRQWGGGFNNVRMSFELAAVIAYRLNRILIVPDIILVHNRNHLQYDPEVFFDFSSIGIQIVKLSKYCEQTAQPNSFEEIKQRSKTYDFQFTDCYLNFSRNEPDAKYLMGRQIITLDDTAEILCFDGNLIGNYYTSIYDDNMHEINLFMCKHIHYKESIFNIANDIIQYIHNNYNQEYYSLHIRRRDFTTVYSQACSSYDQILENIAKIIPKGACLYIATDVQDTNEMSMFKNDYTVIFLQDIMTKMKICICEDIVITDGGPEDALREVTCQETDTQAKP